MSSGEFVLEFLQIFVVPVDVAHSTRWLCSPSFHTDLLIVGHELRSAERYPRGNVGENYIDGRHQCGRSGILKETGQASTDDADIIQSRARARGSFTCANRFVALDFFVNYSEFSVCCATFAFSIKRVRKSDTQKNCGIKRHRC